MPPTATRKLGAGEARRPGRRVPVTADGRYGADQRNQARPDRAQFGLFRPRLPVLVDGGIRAALDNSPYQIELYEEPLQGILFSDPASQKEIREGFIRKYRDRMPDLIIAVGPSPTIFMAEAQKEFGSHTTGRFLCDL